MKVSVIIPVYNTCEFLEECLESVVNQVYKNLEIIIINDGSTDHSQLIIDKFAKKDHRISAYNFDEHKGVGAARNFGIEKATGDYIYFLDSDDYINEYAIQILVENVSHYSIVSGVQTKVTHSVNQDKQKPMGKFTKCNISRENCFDNGSALNRLISLKLIRNSNAKFAEDVEHYSDLAFLTLLARNTRETLCFDGEIYFKRKRNDPISNPSLSQHDEGERITDFLKTFIQLKSKSIDYKEHIFLDNHFITIFKTLTPHFFCKKKNLKLFYKNFAESAKLIDLRHINKIDKIARFELKKLFKNKKKIFEYTIKAHGFLVLLKKFMRSKNKRRFVYTLLYRNLFMRLPLKENAIVFESFFGKSYSDSPKAIYEYMLNHCKNYKYIWIYSNKKLNIPGNIKQVKRFSLKYYYFLGTSKYWVSNSRLPLHLMKRKGNIYLQTWHGTPLKRLVFDMNEVYSANPNYKKNFYHQSRRWDYLISPNQYSSEIFRRAFKYDKELLEVGYPRNDILYHPNKKELIKSIKQRIGLPLDKKVILYAPTWRDDEYYESGKYKFKLKLDLMKMKELLGSEYVILLRMHYFIADKIATEGLEGFAYNLSSYDDIAELYLISDVLITDYSSVLFDYAHLRRPMLFFTYDLEKYRDTLRGFYINMEEDLPGPLLKTTDEIIYSIQNLSQIESNYKEKYDEFYQHFCSWDQGNASELVVKRVFK